MAVLSNIYFFPFLQISFLGFLVWALWRDGFPFPRRRPGDAALTVKRGDASMSLLEKVTGLVAAAIITIINKSVFEDDKAVWRHYSAAIDTFDMIVIVYLCYVSPFGRNFIFSCILRLKEERR